MWKAATVMRQISSMQRGEGYVTSGAILDDDQGRTTTSRANEFARNTHPSTATMTMISVHRLLQTTMNVAPRTAMTMMMMAVANAMIVVVDDDDSTKTPIGVIDCASEEEDMA